MPCNDGGAPSSWAQDQDDIFRQKRLDKVTRLLCTLLGQLEKAGTFEIYATPDLREWWTKHKLDDQKRSIAEIMQRERKIARARADILELQKEITKLEEEKKGL